MSEQVKIHFRPVGSREPMYVQVDSDGWMRGTATHAYGTIFHKHDDDTFQNRDTKKWLGVSGGYWGHKHTFCEFSKKSDMSTFKINSEDQLEVTGMSSGHTGEMMTFDGKDNELKFDKQTRCDVEFVGIDGTSLQGPA